jgi:flagellar biosynthetic protein FliO
MKPVKVLGICMQAVRGLRRRKRAIIGLGMLAGLFVALSFISPAATGQAVDGSANMSGDAVVEDAGGISAAGRAGVETPDDVPKPGLGGMALKVLGSVLLLIGVLYAGMYAMRVLSGRSGKGGFNSDAISVLHKTHIAPKKAIYVVKVGEKAMVVGVTDSQISHLSDLSEEELGTLKASDKPTSKGRSFRQHLLGFALGGKERV